MSVGRRCSFTNELPQQIHLLWKGMEQLVCPIFLNMIKIHYVVTPAVENVLHTIQNVNNVR